MDDRASGYDYRILYRARGAGGIRSHTTGGGYHFRSDFIKRHEPEPLSAGVALSLGLAMIRVLTGISIFWFIIPGYITALALSFFVPKIFTAIAFDSGGVASGPMTATFLLPFAMGACEGVGGNIVTDAFGVVAMVAMTPLITIQILGLVYQINSRHLEKKEARKAAAAFARLPDNDIIEL